MYGTRSYWVVEAFYAKDGHEIERTKTSWGREKAGVALYETQNF